MGIRYRLLIVDDDRAVREVSAAAFQINNYEVTTAGDGVAALQVLRHSAPQVLISDLQMPVMDGYALLRIARRFFPEIGVIAISGAWNPSLAVDHDLADAFYSKGSTSFVNLLECVAELTSRYPVRSSSARLPGVSPTWIMHNGARRLAIACNKCEKFFLLERSLTPKTAGIHDSQCQHCKAKLTFLVESSSLEAWNLAA
ncbi:MAG TPA: response regulator [Candidatus Angelobacter sp.]|jgi:CheY-like chemotaxis protein